MVYGAEWWAVRKKEERKLHITEMRMLRWARGKTRLDHVRNVDIWKEAYMYPMAEFLREKRLRWFGHVQRRDYDETTRIILQVVVDGKRNRGRPKLRWRDLVKEDIDLYRENAIAIESEARDPFGGNVYFVTMQIMFPIPEFARKERNLHCDVVHVTTKWVSRLVLDHAIAAIQTSR